MVAVASLLHQRPPGSHTAGPSLSDPTDRRRERDSVEIPKILAEVPLPDPFTGIFAVVSHGRTGREIQPDGIAFQCAGENKLTRLPRGTRFIPGCCLS
jgi:hypothetical protein